MPAAMDNFDDLSNEQLHLRLLEYGMANMPVTTTTRNVLIKRLRHVIGTASKTRRETVHVTQFSSDESESEIEAKKTKTVARRATMAPSKASTPPRTTRASATPPPVLPKTITTRRSSGRITPLADKEVAPTKVSAQAPIIEIEEESDTEGIIIRTQPAREPSMGKSETVVTSFQHTVPSTPIVFEVYDDDEFDNDSIELESSNDVEVQTYTSGRSQNSAGKHAKPLSTLGRNTISTSYNTSYRQSDAYQRPTYASTSMFKSPPVDDVDITEAPYLSDFTRRLSKLRAEPLVITPINDDSTHSYAYRPSGRKAAVKERDESLWRSFFTMLQIFNRQYGHIIVVFLFMFVSISFYVIFLKND